MNKVCLTGNLCKDIEVRKTQSGMSVVSNTIAVSRDFKDKDGNYPSDFINIVVWDKAADYLDMYAHKGDRAEVTGRIQSRTYQAKDGTNRDVIEVQVESIKVFAKRDAAASKEPETKKAEAKPKKNPTSLDVNDDDLPF